MNQYQTTFWLKCRNSHKGSASKKLNIDTAAGAQLLASMDIFATLYLYPGAALADPEVPHD